MNPKKAFILSAGFSTRLRPLTNNIPKPMVMVNGTTMIDRTIDHLKRSGVHSYVVNTHYKAGVIHDHFAGCDDVFISHEEELLDTGGGIKAALPQFKGEDFFVLSGDGLWSDGPSGNTIQNLANRWNPETMDILMLLQPVETMHDGTGVGDYDIDENGRATRSLDQTGRYMFTSIRINSTSIFNDTPNGAFSYLALMDKAEKDGKLYGLVNDGQWYHISTPEDLTAAERDYIEAQA